MDAFFNAMLRSTRRTSFRVPSSRHGVDDTTPRMVRVKDAESAVVLRLRTRRVVGKPVTARHACVSLIAVVVTTYPFRRRPLVEARRWAPIPR